MALRDRYRDGAPVYFGSTSNLTADAPRGLSVSDALGASSNRSRYQNQIQLAEKTLGLQKNTFDDYEQLVQFAKQYPGVPQELTQEEEKVGVFKRAMQILNTGSSLGAGFLAGITDEKKGNVLETMRDFWSNTKGYGQLLEQWGLRADDTQTKIARGVWGLMGDIFLDPITYVPIIGVGLAASKIIGRGGKVVKTMVPTRIFNATEKIWETKLIEKSVAVLPDGVKALEQVRQGRLMSWEEQLISDTVKLNRPQDIPRLKKEASALAQRDVDRLLQEHIIKEGALNPNSFDQAFIDTVGRNTLEELQKLAPTMIDRGGVKLFGQNLLGSKIFADTAVGKAAQKIYEETGFGGLVAAIKTPFAKMFGTGAIESTFMKDLVARGEYNQQMQLSKIAQRLEDSSAGLSNSQLDEIGYIGVLRNNEQSSEVLRLEDLSTRKLSTMGILGQAMAKMVGGKSFEGSGKGAAQVLEILPDYYKNVVGPLQKRLTKIVEEIDPVVFEKIGSKDIVDSQVKLKLAVKKLDDVLEEIRTTGNTELETAQKLKETIAKKYPESVTKYIPIEEEKATLDFLTGMKKEALEKHALDIRNKLAAAEEADFILKFGGSPDDAIEVLANAGLKLPDDILEAIGRGDVKTLAGAGEKVSDIKRADEVEKTINDWGASFIGLSKGKLTGLKIVDIEDPISGKIISIDSSKFSEEKLVEELARARRRVGLDDEAAKIEDELAQKRSLEEVEDIAITDGTSPAVVKFESQIPEENIIFEKRTKYTPEGEKIPALEEDGTQKFAVEVRNKGQKIFNRIEGYISKDGKSVYINKFSLNEGLDPAISRTPWQQEVRAMLNKIGEQIPENLRASTKLFINTDVKAAKQFLDELGLKEIKKGKQLHYETTVGKLRAATARLSKKIESTRKAVSEVSDIRKELQNFGIEYQNVYRQLVEHYNIRKTIKQKYANMPKHDFKNADMNKFADELWYNPDSITKQLAKLSGLPEDQWFKEYMPLRFKEYSEVRSLATGRDYSINKGIGKRKQVWDIDQIKGELDLNAKKIIGEKAKTLVTNRVKMDVVRKAVKHLGKPLDFFESDSAAIRAGYRKFMVKDPIRRQTRAVKDTVMDKETQRELGILDSNVRAVAGDVVYGGWVPKEVYKELKEIISSKESSLSIFAKMSGFDYATQLTKAYLTSLFLQFHVQNITSNQLQAILQMGYSVTDMKTFKLSYMMARAADKGVVGGMFKYADAARWLKNQTIVRKDGSVMSASELLKQIKKKNPELLVSGQFGRYELGASAQGILERITGGKFNPLNPKNVALAAGREFGQTFENQAKLSIIIDAWQKGFDIEDGVKLAEEAIFNYGKLTKFEKEVMRRVIPFYTFARKNLEYQMKKLLIAPGYTAAQFKLMNNLNHSLNDALTTDDEGLPAYIRDSLGFGVGNVGKGGKYFFSFGLPIEEFLSRLSGEDGIVVNTMKNVFQQFNPLLKYPLEFTTGKDVFRNKDIVELDRPDMFVSMIGSMDNALGKTFKKFVGLREDRNVPVYKDGKIVGYKTVYHANPYVLHFLRSLPTSRLEQTISTYAGMDQYEGSDMATKIIAYTLGVNVNIPDAEAQKYFSDREKYKELGDWLTRAGFDLKKYESYYRERSPAQKNIERVLGGQKTK